MGTFVEVRCKNGTVLSGEGFLSCTESGTWDFPMPKCSAIPTTTAAPTTTTAKATLATTATTARTTITTTRTTTKKPTTKTRATTRRPVMTRTTTKKPTTTRAITKIPTTTTTLATTAKSTTTARTTNKPMTTRTRTTIRPTTRPTTKKPVKTTTTARPKTSTTPKPVATTVSASTEASILLREIGTDPDETFWQNWKNLLYFGCENSTSNRSPFCDQVENPNEYSDLRSFDMPETAEYRHMDTKLLRHLTDARKALQSPLIRSDVNIGNLLPVILYGDQYPDPPTKMPKTMENSIRIVLCVYIDTILLDKNFKPDMTMHSNDDITQKLKSSLWQVASFAHQNYRMQQAAKEATTVLSSDIDFFNMDLHTMRRLVETTSPAVDTETTTEYHGTTTIVSGSNIPEENIDSPPMKTTLIALVPKSCDLKTLIDRPENSLLIKMVSRDGTMSTDFTNNITAVSIGSKLFFDCLEGYEMIGASKVTAAECKEDLSWTNLLFECKGNLYGRCELQC